MKRKKMNYILDILSVVIIALLIILAFFIRLSYKNYQDEYLDYRLISSCDFEEFQNLLDKNKVFSFDDVLEQAQEAVVVHFKGKSDVHKENISYFLEVERVLKGALTVGENIEVMEHGVFDGKSQTAFYLYGGVPFLPNQSYLLLLNQQEQHYSKANPRYYLTTQSPLGKYPLESKVELYEDQDRPVKDYLGISFIAASPEAATSYQVFYEAAQAYCIPK